jgi:CheY-like chemotaxis protein
MKQRPMLEILVAEDHPDTARVYRMTLEDRGHWVTIATNGEDCLKIYHEVYQKVILRSNPKEHIQPFDVVVLDYKMPKINGIEVAKEILTVNSRQRIVLASAYLQDTLIKSLQQLKQIVEVLNKPFSQQELLGTVENAEIYSELKELDVDVETLKGANLTNEQLRELIPSLIKERKRQVQQKKEKEMEDNKWLS